MPHFDVKGRQPERLDTGIEHHARMRLERQHAPRNAVIPGGLPGGGDDRLVAQMNTVEIADGNGAAPVFGGYFIKMSVDTHGPGKCQHARQRSRGKAKFIKDLRSSAAGPDRTAILAKGQKSLPGRCRGIKVHAPDDWRR